MDLDHGKAFVSSDGVKPKRVTRRCRINARSSEWILRRLECSFWVMNSLVRRIAVSLLILTPPPIGLNINELLNIYVLFLTLLLGGKDTKYFACD